VALLPHNLARVKNRDTNSSTMKGKCLARASSYGHVARGVQAGVAFACQLQRVWPSGYVSSRYRSTESAVLCYERPDTAVPALRRS
jgi:hypothetical protein